MKEERKEGKGHNVGERTVSRGKTARHYIEGRKEGRREEKKEGMRGRKM